MKVSRGTGRFSERIIQKAILKFYKDHSLWPRGIVEEMSCIQLWSLKVAKALCRLAAGLNFFPMYSELEKSYVCLHLPCCGYGQP